MASSLPGWALLCGLTFESREHRDCPGWRGKHAPPTSLHGLVRYVENAARRFGDLTLWGAIVTRTTIDSRGLRNDWRLRFANGVLANVNAWLAHHARDGGYPVALEAASVADAEAGMRTMKSWLRAAVAEKGGERAPETRPALRAAVSIYSGGVSDERFKRVAEVLEAEGSASEKLCRIDRLLALPPTASAAALGRLLGVTAAAVKKTRWWREHRAGECRRRVAQRASRLMDRGKAVERSEE
jgi:hypothetical protein